MAADILLEIEGITGRIEDQGQRRLDRRPEHLVGCGKRFVGPLRWWCGYRQG